MGGYLVPKMSFSFGFLLNTGRVSGGPELLQSLAARLPVLIFLSSNMGQRGQRAIVNTYSLSSTRTNFPCVFVFVSTT